MIFSTNKASFVCKILFLDVDSLSIELVILPLTIVFISPFILHLSLTASNSFVPLSLIYSIGCFLDAKTCTVSIFEFTFVLRFFYHCWLSFDWVFLSFHYDFDSLPMLIIILEITDINDVFAIFQLTLTMIFPINKRALIDEGTFFASTCERTSSIRYFIDNVSIILCLFWIISNINILLNSLIETVSCPE